MTTPAIATTWTVREELRGEGGRAPGVLGADSFPPSSPGSTQRGSPPPGPDPRPGSEGGSRSDGSEGGLGMTTGIAPAAGRVKKGTARGAGPGAPPGRRVSAAGLGPALPFLALVLPGDPREHVVHRREPHDFGPGDLPRLLHDPGERPVLTVGLLLDLVQHVLGEVE